MNKIRHLRQILLTTVAVLGLAAGAQAQDTAKPEFKRNEFSISAGALAGDSYFGLLVLPALNYKYSYYVSPKVALGVKYTFFYYMDFMLGVKYKYYNGERISLSASSYHGIVSANYVSESVFCSSINPLEINFKLYENGCMFMNMGTMYGYGYNSIKDSLIYSIELGYSFSF